MNERTRAHLERLDPEARARAEEALAAARTPDRRAAEEAYRARFGPRHTPDELFAMGEIDAESRDRMTAALEARRAGSAPGLAATLRAERERQGLSLAEVAARAGLERGVVHKLEAGTNGNPTLATLDRIAHALGKRLAWALEDAGG